MSSQTSGPSRAPAAPGSGSGSWLEVVGLVSAADDDADVKAKGVQVNGACRARTSPSLISEPNLIFPSR